MHDIVIRGGSIVDGTGAPAFNGDITIDQGRISAVGGRAGPARRVIDADGRLVTPGWVDVHTHYDGQATWDPILAPSSWHGVTTILFGNCGVGFAPVRPYHRSALIDLMEGVEDIPGPVLAEGLKWDWQSFPDFLDALERHAAHDRRGGAGAASPAARLCHGRPGLCALQWQFDRLSHSTRDALTTPEPGNGIGFRPKMSAPTSPATDLNGFAGRF